MKNNLYFVNLILILEVGLYCLISVIAGSFAPTMMIPQMTLPFLVLLSVIPMIIKFYMAPNTRGNEWITILLGGITLTVLPLCAGLITDISVLKMFVAGVVTFGITWFIYDSIGKRISSGPYGRFAPIANGLMLYLASQCLQGLL